MRLDHAFSMELDFIPSNVFSLFPARRQQLIKLTQMATTRWPPPDSPLKNFTPLLFRTHGRSEGRSLGSDVEASLLERAQLLCAHPVGPCHALSTGAFPAVQQVPQQVILRYLRSGSWGFGQSVATSPGAGGAAITRQTWAHASAVCTHERRKARVANVQAMSEWP